MIPITILLVFTAFYLIIKSKNIHIWFVSYIKNVLTRKLLPRADNEKIVYFSLVDHFEPYWRNDKKELAIKRVKSWSEKYEKLARKHKDSNNNSPKHTFFYPWDEYDEDCINELKKITDIGLGDVEVHLHHDNDTQKGLKEKLDKFKEDLYFKHKLLRKDGKGEIIFAFIHGNWCLDNSRKDGKYCGVNNEISVLVESGCYADLTMPSAPSETQTRIINSIYYAKGKEGKTKSHDSGRIVYRGIEKSNEELLFIQGPLTLNWKNRKSKILPRIEAAELSYDARMTEDRVDLWLTYAPKIIVDDVEHIFVKIHTHGAEDKNIEYLLNGGLSQMWGMLERRIDKKTKLCYVTTFEMYKKINELVKI